MGMEFAKARLAAKPKVAKPNVDYLICAFTYLTLYESDRCINTLVEGTYQLNDSLSS